MDTSRSKNRLLLVDGDAKSLRVLDVSLKKAGFEVTTATSGREALSSLETDLPDLIISDTDLDEMDGFELCNRIKAKPEWAKIPFLFVSGRKSIEDKIRGLELGVDDYLTKPIYIKEIGIRVRTALQRAERERMESRRDSRTRFAGDLSDVGVVDLVQTIELNRKSGIIHIVSRDERHGSIFFRDGKVVDAEVGRLSGAHAIYRLFSWAEGQFAVEFKQIRRHDVIETSMAALLMEGMRRLDESARLLENLPSTKSVLEVDCRVLAEELAELPDEMNSVLRLCDGARTMQEVVEDSDYPDLEALGIINKLFAGQIIFARDAPERARQSEPSARLARWLSEGGAEGASAVEEPRPSSTNALLVELQPSGGTLHASTEMPVVLADKQSSGEETLLAALPSRADAVDASGDESERAAETLKGIPVENLFVDVEAKLEAEPSNPAVAEAREPTVSIATEGRSTKPLGLAERLLSADSALRASAMHEATSDDEGKVTEPLPTDRNTRSYGDPPDEAAAALVQEVVSSTHERKREVVLPTEPERPRKEVDWGAWPASAEPSIPSSKGPTPAAARPAAETPLVATSAEKDTKAAELDSSDVEEVEPGTVSAISAEPTAAPPKRTAGRPQPPPLDDRTEDATPEPMEEPVGTETPVDQPAVARSTEAAVAQDKLVSAFSRAWQTTPAWEEAKPSRAWLAWLLLVPAFVLGAVAYLSIDRRESRSSESRQIATPQAATLPPAALQAPAPAAPAEQEVHAARAPASPTSVVAAANPAPTGAEENRPAQTEHAVAATPPAVDVRQQCLDVNAEGRGKARSVLAACRPALQAAPKDAEVMVILARAEIDRGRLVEARSLARKALVADPQRFDAYVYLGTAEQEAGRIEEARAAYKKYLELAPDGPYAHELRAILSNL
jgi:CheY-like chemotaxis protein